MKRSYAVLAFMVATILVIPTTNAAAPKSGSPCPKSGISKIYKGKKLYCVKNGNKTSWSYSPQVNKTKSNKLNSQTSQKSSNPRPMPSPSNSSSQNENTSTVTPTPKPKSKNVVTDATKYIQSIIDSIEIDYSANLPKPIIQIESGPNGEYFAFATKSINDSLAWFNSLGFKHPLTKIDYVFGRTVKWLEIKIDEVAPGCREIAKRYSPGWSPIGSAALCGTNERGGVYSHMVNAIVPGICCSNSDEVTSKVDLSLQPLNRFAWHTFPHETFHTWQQANCKLGCSNYLPNWMNEGAAQLFTYMLWSKLENTPVSYLEFDAEEVSMEKRFCTSPLSGPGITSPAPIGCDYSKGLIAMEFFVYKFGVSGYIKLWSQVQSSNLETEFNRILGASYNEFNKDLDEYLKLKGW